MTPAGAPTLPTTAILEAMEADELDVAMGLIANHERDVRAALGNPGATAPDQSAWFALLAEQNSLLEHLQYARVQASEALQRLKINHDSVQAYKDGGAR